MGGTVARLAVAAGLDVVLSNSRGPQTLSGLVDQLGMRATAATVEDAARAGDWVVLAVPFGAYPQIPFQPLAGKTVLETTNFFGGSERAAGTAASSELVQRHLAGAHVVKAFNTVLPRQLHNLARPAGAPDRSALPVAGDDPVAKAEAVRLLDLLGWDTVDAGTQAESWRMQPGTPAFLTPYMANSRASFATRLATDPGKPANTQKIHNALDAARR
ncbi:MAG: NAD(P)-binding domain-containing protein [Chloroflexota bacterium]|nr:NAD(P)-binding domain-containing protein [Chloroflexota bacterium]